MKLLFITHSKYLQPMEAHRVFRYLGDEMQRRGHTVHYFFERRQDTEFRPLSALTHAIRIAPFIGTMCRRKRYDALICPGSLGWCLSTFREWLLPRTTRIISWHAGHEALIEPNRTPSRRRQLYHGLQRWSSRQALETQDGWMVNATDEVERLRDIFPAETHKIAYLPMGVSAQFYDAERYWNAVTPRSERLLWIGPWDTSPDNALVAAWPALHAKHPQLGLSLLNTQLPADAILSRFPAEAHTAITVQPSTDENELIDAYRQHHIFILPTQTRTAPLALLEAMAAQLPIISPSQPGAHDIVTHYENGMLIPPQDANALEQTISHLIENPELCRQLGEAAYDTVSRLYTWRQIADIFEGHLSRWSTPYPESGPLQPDRAQAVEPPLDSSEP